MESNKRKSRLPAQRAGSLHQRSFSHQGAAKRGRGGRFLPRGVGSAVMAAPAVRSGAPKPRAIVDAFVGHGSNDGVKNSSEEGEDDEGMLTEQQQGSGQLEDDFEVDPGSGAEPSAPQSEAVQRGSETALYRTPSSRAAVLGRNDLQSAVAPGPTAAQRIRQRESDAQALQVLKLENEKLRLELEVRVILKESSLSIHNTNQDEAVS